MAIMHMTAIALARGGVAAAAGPAHGQGPEEGVTAHAAEATAATAGVINPHHTQSAKAVDLGPQHVPSPEVQCAGRPEVQCAGRPEVQCAGRPEVQCAGRPEVQCAEQQVAPDLDPGPCPAPGRAASPDLAPGPSPAQPPPRGTVDPGLRARGKAPLPMPTDHGGETAPCPLLFRCPLLPRGLKPFYTFVYVFDFFLLSFFNLSLAFHPLALALFHLYVQRIPKLLFPTCTFHWLVLVFFFLHSVCFTPVCQSFFFLS